MKKQAYNPYLPEGEYIPDGEPHVFGDRIYIFGSHDQFNGTTFCQNDYVCYSADTKDLSNWRFEGTIYCKKQDPRNRKEEHAMWAPDVAKGPDGRYYLYYCLDYLPQIGVAVCDTPAGQYEFLDLVRYPDGTPLGEKEGDWIQFDPAILVEEDGSVYLYSGNAPMSKKYMLGKMGYLLTGGEKKSSQVMRLSKDMVTLAQKPQRLLCDVRDSEKTDFYGHEFFEASSIRKIKNTYYFVYSSVHSHELCYAVSKKPDRDFRFGGTLVDIGDVFKNGRTEEEAVNCLGNTHGGIECIDGQWYVFYHRHTNGTQYSRQGCAEKIFIKEDGEIDQAEVTSCGLNDGPLDGRGWYPAYICCHLTGKNGAAFSNPLTMKEAFPYLTQDISGQYIANITKGTIIGYKYFSFDAKNNKRIAIRIKLFLRKNPKCQMEEIKGLFYVGKNPRGTDDGIITVNNPEDNWTEFEGSLLLEPSIRGLYLMYEGDGALDFRAFEMVWEED